MTEMTFAEAACLALEQEMTRDRTVWALGEDLSSGMQGQYRGLHERFGPRRIFDTPISENSIMGTAVGAAVCGTRPVVELRNNDFAICATDEIVNNAAKIRYMYGGQARVPLVARLQMGAPIGYPAQHTQFTEAWYVHTPGLVVIAPSTPADNHALLKAAIRSDDPIIYLEHKELWKTRGSVDPDVVPAAIGKAEIVKRGADLTVVAWSRMRHVCVAAAKMLDQSGTSVEVIDLRSLWPWDRDTVMESVSRTRRLLIAHESVRVGGFGAEIAAEIGESLWGKLRAPIRRLGQPRSTDAALGAAPQGDPYLGGSRNRSGARTVAGVLVGYGAAALSRTFSRLHRRLVRGATFLSSRRHKLRQVYDALQRPHRSRHFASQRRIAAGDIGQPSFEWSIDGRGLPERTACEGTREH